MQVEGGDYGDSITDNLPNGPQQIPFQIAEIFDNPRSVQRQQAS